MLPKLPKQPEGPLSRSGSGRISTAKLEVIPEEGFTLAGTMSSMVGPGRHETHCLILQYNDHDKPKEPEALREVLLKKHGAELMRFPLRGTEDQKTPKNAVAGAPDHNSAEYGVWLGRSLLSQWVVDVRAVFSHPLVHGRQWPEDPRRHWPDARCWPSSRRPLFPTSRTRPSSSMGRPASSRKPLMLPGTPMGILAPGILKVGDIPHLASLIAPRRLIIAGGALLNGKNLTEKELQEAFAFTSKVYGAIKAAEKLTINRGCDVGEDGSLTPF